MTSRLAATVLAASLLVGCSRPIASPTPAEPSPAPATASLTPAPPTRTPTNSPTPAPPSPTPGPDAVELSQGVPLAQVDYRVPLVVRHVTPQQAILEFRLTAPANGELLVAPDPPTGAVTRLPFDGTGGNFTVPDLAPAASYRAAVLIETPDGQRQPAFLGDRWGLVTFRTQPETPADFSVAVVGDSGFGGQATVKLAALMASYRPDFVLHTGDLVYNLQDDPSPADGFLKKLFQPFAPLMRSAPFYPSLGNHDLEAAAFAAGTPYDLLAFPPFVDPAMPDVTSGQGGWYAFSQRGVQFVVLNSQVVFGYPGQGDETRWLADRLADPRFRATIVTLHVPIYDVGYHALDSVPVRGAWGEMIQNANVPLVLSGHDHNYQRFEVSGKTYLISGGGSATLYPVTGNDPSLRASAKMTHFVLLTFTATTIHIQAIDLSGHVFDDAMVPWSGWASSRPPDGESLVACAALDRLAVDQGRRAIDSGGQGPAAPTDCSKPE